jgi:hypothetical protein
MLTREFRSTLFSGVKIEVIKAPFRNKNSKNDDTKGSNWAADRARGKK